MTLNHVLEHVPRPGPFLTEVHRVLRPDGLPFVAVPNVHTWQFLLKRGRYAWTFQKDFSIRHRQERPTDEAIETATPETREGIDALQALRGVARISAATIVAEVGRMSRFAKPGDR